MKNRYEALLVVNSQGKEDSVHDIVERLESEFKKEGVEVEQVQKMDKRQFSYVAGPLDSGFYVNFVFDAPSTTIAELDAKLHLEADVFRWQFTELIEPPVRKPRKIPATGVVEN